jgi:hypothetical protein
MQDLRSLLAFLHFRPFSEPAVFNKYIIESLSSQDPDPARNLRALLSVLCFRRTRSLLSLPPSDFFDVSVIRTNDETQRYEEILASAKLEYESIANMKTTKKKHTVLFTTVMGLRRLCSHGLQQGDVQKSLQGNATELRLQVPKPGNKKRKRENVAFSRFCEDCCGGDLDPSLGVALREYCPTCCDSPPPGLDDDLVIESMSSSPMDFESSSASSPAAGTFENQRAFPGLPAANYLERAQPSSKISAVVTNVEDSPQGHKKSAMFPFQSVRLHLRAQRV